MRTKQIFLWMLILSLASTAIACQPAFAVSAPAIAVLPGTSIAALAMPPASRPMPAFQGGSGIYLMASIGPTCTTANSFGPECRQPYAGEFVVTELNGAEVTRVATNYQGQAMVALSPGRYLVGVRTEEFYPRAAPAVVNVLANRYAYVSFSLDTGIRPR
jgi:hypothetical protein